MTENEAHAQAFENGRKVGDAEGYARGKAEACVVASDLISRRALLEKQYNASRFNNPSMAEMVVDVRDIRNAPTIDAQPVRRAHWIRTGHGMKCSNPECRCLSALWDDNLKSTYCPWCGARMDGGGDGKD